MVVPTICQQNEIVSGLGSAPIIDGSKTSADNWDEAGTVTMDYGRAGEPKRGTLTITTKHDHEKIYFLLEWDDESSIWNDDPSIYFEDDGTTHDGILDGVNEDEIYSRNVYPCSYANDGFWFWKKDEWYSDGGIYFRSVKSACSYSNGRWVYEVEKELNTGEIYDISVPVGSEEILGFAAINWEKSAEPGGVRSWTWPVDDYGTGNLLQRTDPYKTDLWGDLIITWDEEEPSEEVALANAYHININGEKTQSLDSKFLNVHEGDLVVLEPYGFDEDEIESVEWYDRFDRKTHTLENFYIGATDVTKFKVDRNTIFKLETFSDAAMTEHSFNFLGGDTVYFKITILDFEGNPKPGTLYVELLDTTGEDSYSKIADTTGVFTDSFVFPSDTPTQKSFSVAFETREELVGPVFSDFKFNSGIATFKSEVEMSYSFLDAMTDINKDEMRYGSVIRAFAVHGGAGYLDDGTFFDPGHHLIEMNLIFKNGSTFIDTILINVSNAYFINEKKISVILAKFSDKDFQRDLTAYEFENIILSRLNNYYEENSWGRVRWNYKLFSDDGEPFTIGSTSKYTDAWFEKDDIVEINNDAQTEAKASDPTASSWISSSVAVVVIYPDLAGRMGGAWEPASEPSKINVEEADLGMLAHELGHELGLADKYESATWLPSDIGGWGLMGNVFRIHPQHMTSDSKRQLGWISEDSKGNGEYTITALPSTDKVFKIDSLIGTTLQIEARTKAKKISYWDRSVPDTGIIIYKKSSLFGDTSVLGVLKSEGWWMEVPLLNKKITFVENRLDSDGTADIKIESISEEDIVGTVIDVICPLCGIVGSLIPSSNGSLPDLDLHAFYTIDGQQKHAGMNYETSEYECPEDAICSGDYQSQEWIFVPSNADVEFKVFNRDVKQFMEENPEILDMTNGSAEYQIMFVSYDSEGDMHISEPERHSISNLENGQPVIKEETYSPPAQTDMVKVYDADTGEFLNETLSGIITLPPPPTDQIEAAGLDYTLFLIIGGIIGAVIIVSLAFMKMRQPPTPPTPPIEIKIKPKPEKPIPPKQGVERGLSEASEKVKIALQEGVAPEKIVETLRKDGYTDSEIKKILAKFL